MQQVDVFSSASSKSGQRTEVAVDVARRCIQWTELAVDIDILNRARD